MEEDDPLRQLFASLQARRRPEDIAELVRLVLTDQLDRREMAILMQAARGALARSPGSYSSMSDDFFVPVGMDRQFRVAGELFSAPLPVEGSKRDPSAVKTYLVAAQAEIGKQFGRSDFRADRLNREARLQAGLSELSGRRYNKLFRLAARMEEKRRRFARELEKRAVTLIGKSRLASSLTWEEFSADAGSACFIAYFTARCNLRSEFTIGGQQRPYDSIAEMLFTRCRRASSWRLTPWAKPTANWWAIAHVYPDREVLAHLTDFQKGELLGRWFSVLERLARFLHQLWETNEIDRRTMIVQRGNDSTTWNQMAGAWNKARDAWFSLLFAMDMEAVLEAMCPGKVLRLMAADVAAWHKAAGGNLNRDTFVWAEIPLPWQVLSGDADCPRTFVERVCSQQGVDPAKSGWAAPRSGGKVQQFRPTPELVHGVDVGHAGLAAVLRKAGVFSGKAT